MLTDNEIKILRLLMVKYKIDYSINEMARECSLTPNGALKILRKFEHEGILKVKKIGNIRSFELIFDNDKTEIILEYALIPKLEGRLKNRVEDLKVLRETVKVCILFGSYIDLKKNPNDMDILCILDKTRFKEYKKKLSEAAQIMPVKIHDVVQTEDDLADNLCKSDTVIIEILKKGIVLWGQKELLKVIMHVHTGKA
ncbi:MAG: hypothetical protein KJ601_00380 [Nanoarchaeota archaeon]|nr:hypothetical protein [Nanoarchaeota archaeon]